MQQTLLSPKDYFHNFITVRLIKYYSKRCKNIQLQAMAISNIDDLHSDRTGAGRLITRQQMDNKGRRRVQPRGPPTIHHRRPGLARPNLSAVCAFPHPCCCRWML